MPRAAAPPDDGATSGLLGVRIPTVACLSFIQAFKLCHDAIPVGI